MVSSAAGVKQPRGRPRLRFDQVAGERYRSRAMCFKEGPMTRKVFLLTIPLLFVAGLALADDKKATKLATGTVKAVSQGSLTVMQGAQEFQFVVDNETEVIGKGAGTKTKTAKEAGKGVVITDLVKENQRVMVRYREAEGKLVAAQVRLQ